MLGNNLLVFRVLGPWLKGKCVGNGWRIVGGDDLCMVILLWVILLW